MAIRQAGHGPHVLVLIHGGPGTSDPDLFTGFRLLATRGFRVVYYDQRGVAATPAPVDADYSPDAYIADLEALRVRLGVDSLDLLGDSWGGEVMALYTAAFPKHVHAVAEIGGKPLDENATDRGLDAFQTRIALLQREHLVPTSIPPRSHNNCAPFLNALLPVYAANPRHPYRRFTVVKCSPTAGDATDSALVADADRVNQLRYALTAWHGRALIIQGDNDPFGSAFTDADVAEFAGARVTRTIIPHAGHFTWEDDPTLVDRIGDCLAQ